MKRLMAGLVFLGVLLGTASAQERNIQHTRIYTVKHDRFAEWTSTIKELQALYKKAGVDAPTLIFQSVTGQDTFLVVRYYEKMSQAVANRADAFKGPHEAEYRALNIRLMSTVADRRTRVAERDTEVSLPRATAIPPYIRIIRSEVKPGKAEEYRALLKEWVNAGLKPAGVKLFTLTRTRMGGKTDEFQSGTGVNALTELDEQAPRKAMGEAKFNAWFAKRTMVVETSETNLFRYRPELSTWVPAK